MLFELLKRSSPENPSTSLANPAAWMVDAFGGGSSASGLPVTAHSALGFSPIWRAVSLLSKDVARIPLFVYQRNEGDGKERDKTHPAWQLLRHQANAMQTAFHFRMLLQARALLWGNGYAWIRRDRDATPIELIPLDPISTQPWRSPDDRLWYRVRVLGKDMLASAEDILHIRNLVLDDTGDAALSTIGILRDCIGLGLATQRFGSAFYKNSARPGILIQHPGKLSVQAKASLREQWDRLHGGVDNNQRTAVLEEGMTAQPFSMSQRDAEYVKTRELSIRDIANAFGVPPHKIGDTTRTAYNSLEQENHSYLDESLDPWLVTWEAECREKLLTERQKREDTHLVEFLRIALLRADAKTRAEFYNLGVQGGWLSRDEVRSRENMNPIPDGTGSEFLVPLNMGPSGGEQGGDQEGGDDDDPPPVPKEDDDRAARREAARDLVAEALARAAKRVNAQAERAAKDAAKFGAWIDRLEEHRESLAGSLDAIARALRALGAPPATSVADAFLAATREELLSASECRPQDLPSRVERCGVDLLARTIPRIVSDWLEAEDGTA